MTYIVEHIFFYKVLIGFFVMRNDMKSFEKYFMKYWDEDPLYSFYDRVLELAKMEDEFSRREPSGEEVRDYSRLKDDILGECSDGTDIEDLIGMAVVCLRLRRAERKKVFKRLRKWQERNGEGREIHVVKNEDYVPPIVKELYDMIGIEP